MTVLAIAGAGARRVLRDRTALFFMVVLPVLVILIVGATVGGFDSFRVGVVAPGDDPLEQELVAALEASPALDVRTYDDVEAGKTALRRAQLESLVSVEPGTGAALRAGDDVEVVVFGERTNTNQQAARAAVSAAIADAAGRVQAAHFAADRTGGDFDEQLARVPGVAAVSDRVSVREEIVDARSNFLPEGFAYSAPTMMVLFIFINALAGGAALIESRRLGMHERMSAGPVRARSIVLGEAVVYFSIALAQSALIVSAGILLFGVDWGDPLAAGALIVVFALVGTGAGMLSGTVFRTPEQASSIGPAIGIAFGMLGGTMWPLEIVPSFMRTIGHAVPHAWAIDAWTELMSRGGGLADIARPLLVLAGFAAALLALASARLHRRLEA